MEQSEVTQKSTKKDIWEAYQEVLKEIKNVKTDEKEFEQPMLNLKEKKIPAQAVGLTVDKVMNEVGELKISMSSELNKITDKLAEELKRLEAVREAIKIEDKELESLYHIKSEAIALMDLIELRERKKIEWQREQEEYAYNLKLARRKEEDEYELKRVAKEREFNEKLAIREKELKIKEENMKVQEQEIAQLRAKAQTLPEELEKIKAETAKAVKEEMERKMKIESEMTAKDTSKEREIATLKISMLGETIKKQSSQIQTLESALESANQKAQELAVVVIEGGRDRENKRVVEEGVSSKTEK